MTEEHEAHISADEDYIDTREGWRRVGLAEYHNARERHETTLMLDDNPGSPTFWVREAPVPPLPAEPYTVIKVSWRYPFPHRGIDVLMLDQYRPGDWGQHTPTTVAENITGFKVLASPSNRHLAAAIDKAYVEGAKDALNLARKAVPPGRFVMNFDKVARDLGVI